MKKTILLAAVLASGLVGSAFAEETLKTEAQKAVTAVTAVVAPGTMASPTLLHHAQPGDHLSSRIVGAGVYAKSGEKIGAVDDLLIDGSGKVTGIVVGVGGFLGVGEKSVALAYGAVTMGVDDKGKPRLSTQVSKETLEKAPAFEPAAS